MRVIAGKAKSLKLKTIDGISTRPTTDRIKETLFNIINQYIYDCMFLDLFSGSGAIGIEALSRGARKAYFIENNNKAVSCIKENINHTNLDAESVVIKNDVISGLCSIDLKGECFDVVFMDPPYNMQLEKQVLNFLSKSDLINKNKLIIVEASLDTDFSYVNELGFTVKR